MEEETGINTTWRSNYFQSLIYSLFIHWTNLLYTPLWSTSSLTKGSILFKTPSGFTLQSTATSCQGHSSTRCSQPVPGSLKEMQAESLLGNAWLWAALAPALPDGTEDELPQNCTTLSGASTLSFCRPSPVTWGQTCILVWQLSRPPGFLLIFSPRHLL